LAQGRVGSSFFGHWRAAARILASTPMVRSPRSIPGCLVLLVLVLVAAAPPSLWCSLAFAPAGVAFSSAAPLARLQKVTPRHQKAESIVSHYEEEGCPTASEDTMQSVEAIVSRTLGVERTSVGPDSTLSQLGADSVDVVEAVLSLEECFNIDLGDAVLDIELPTPETAKLKNLRDIADLIQCETVGVPAVRC